MQVSSISILSGLLVMTLQSCQPSTPSTKKPSESDLAAHKSEISEQFMVANQQLMQKENDEMDSYVKSHKMPFIKTESGIRYYVYEPSEKGDSIRSGARVELQYKLYLLDGTLCYSSDIDGIKYMEVGNDNVESGIHKGLQLLKRGDKAMLIIPSPLAHGLLGDMKKIPPQMPIVYDIMVK
jgi:FKBP-type peptidyl-prolyl cis-trans isomerase